ncbi:hypothetical protein J2W40_000761 [Sphingobium xenophagum]|uniref:Uncharacterized protein n=1 Tax=Sphingobium xenophagum TaxID=121428 RepID=A0ABU1WXC9_SPHXE|nr:hypothetical protein [Sphingobium xenophagum]MDR7153958.1 hypothetical protein [Sphingobium xenophagum]
MKKAFWKYAYWRYQNRPINPLVEWALIVWGVFWILPNALAFMLRFDAVVTDVRAYACLAVGVVLLAAGLARRTIRKAQVIGGQSALYRKRLEVLNG